MRDQGDQVVRNLSTIMNRLRNTPCIFKLHRITDSDAAFPDSSMILKIDTLSDQVINRTPANVDPQEYIGEISQTIPEENNDLLRFVPKCTNYNFNSCAVRVVRLGGIEELNPLRYAKDGRTSILSENECGGSMLMSPRESKVPNFPLMIRCQNCDTNFPTKYQFQRHQCEFNADKVVLKPNVDARDVGKGLRMKFECKTCGKQFVSKNNLERHLTSHDEDNVNICEYCNKHFVSENRLRIHKENHCKKTGDISKFYRSDVTVWRCTKCFQVFSSEAYTASHAEVCTDIVTDPVAIKDANEDISEVEMNNNFDDCDAGFIAQYVEKVRTELLLQCEFCNRTYANRKSLLWHQDSHTTDVNYNCVICNHTFESYTDAAKHWLTECTNEANLFFLPKLIYCKCCNRTFKSHEILYLHKIKKKHYAPKKHNASKMDDNNQEVKMELEMFQESEIFVNNIEFNDQLNSEATGSEQAVHDQNIQDKDSPNNEKASIIQLIEDVLVSSKNEENELKQEECASKDEYENDKSDSTSEVNLNGSDDTSEEPEKKKRGRKRKAAQNGKSKKFMAEVADGYKYQCERCVELFSTVVDLEMHRNKIHPANYKCDECDQVVHSAKALMIHSRAHKSLKPYVCDICKRSYSQTSHLWQHMRFHQGIKPFACPHEGCEARYTIRPDLKDHIRKVHTRERPFKCTVCDKCFLTGSVYYQHRLIHTNDRRYACDICDKRFFRADALNNHRRIHTDERPYPCSVCGRNFRQKGDRNKHVRTQHPECKI